jgi:putative PIN family toxin of toxin-antitoxin system
VLKVVLDTNQLVSSLLSTRGLQRQLIDAWRAGRFVLMPGPGQIEETGEVLGRPRLQRKYVISNEDREALLRLLRTDGQLLSEAPPAGVCRDPDDDLLLGCAGAAGADCLVTGDEDLLVVGEYRGVRILRAREFLTLLSE